jgi:1-acyl-sn-glycerol-3-phosphate acyltransferase
MQILRSYFVWFFSALFVILMFPFTVTIWIVCYPFDRESTVVHKWMTIQGVVLCRFNLLWKIKLEGREKARKNETYVIISNHQSILDILLITCLRFKLRWISKVENFRIPILNWSMKMAKYIPVERGNPESKIIMMEESIRTLKQETSIMMFPEGTRSKDGRIMDFKKGAFQMAIITGKPVLPIIIDGTGKVLPKKGIVFSGGYLLRARVLDPVYPNEFGSSDPEIVAENFRNLMEIALNKMRKESEVQ